MKPTFALCLLALPAIILGCSSPAPATSNSVAKPYSPPTALTLSAHAIRNELGQVVISGTTNLPDGVKLWVEVEEAAKTAAQDDDVVAKNGEFATAPLWLSVPNTRFTKNGWPNGMNVDERLKPFPEGKFKVHFESHFNEAWQTPEILAALGGQEGKNLNGPILKATDSDVTDSPKIVDYSLTLPFPAISSTAKAINLVRSAILTVPGKGRSAGDIQANVDLFMRSEGLKAAREWAATPKSQAIYEVSYDFINGSEGETQAIWTANIATGQVKYLNESAKTFSWTPNY